MSLIERFLREKKDATIYARPGAVGLVWRDGHGAVNQMAVVPPEELDEYLADVLDVATEKFLTDLGLTPAPFPHLGRWQRGEVTVDPSLGRQAVRDAVIRAYALQADARWRRLAGALWQRSGPSGQWVYDAITNRLTKTETSTPTLEELCS